MFLVARGLIGWLGRGLGGLSTSGPNGGLTAQLTRIILARALSLFMPLRLVVASTRFCSGPQAQWLQLPIGFYAVVEFTCYLLCPYYQQSESQLMDCMKCMTCCAQNSVTLSNEGRVLIIALPGPMLKQGAKAEPQTEELVGWQTNVGTEQPLLWVRKSGIIKRISGTKLSRIPSHCCHLVRSLGRQQIHAGDERT
ncbi:hypothetical protein VNO77_20279 [Canavalia gladiata]|uniref:Uncharacterized protein n=1 Tax=Canavalia gladiata TaxID=3824 RepID=A0AAN9LPB2_CANGL